MLRSFPICLTALALLACERAHPSMDTAQGFLDALTYGDVDGLYALHIDSTAQSEWCRMEFKGALAKAQEQANAEDCQRVRSLTTSDLEAMRDDLRLAVQITGWSCENRQGTCVDYAHTVFEQAAAAHPLVKQKPKSATIRRVFGDESTGAAYVDIVRGDDTTEHLTLELRKAGEGWRVAQGFLSP